MSTRAIAGRYRLEGRLGVGGMSTVDYAFDERLERKVAIKLLAEHLADDPAFVSRFRREALAAARLVHPNIVQVYDFGFDEVSHRHFIVMELVSGQSCAEILRDRGHLPTDEAVEVVAQACRGLAYAHRHGVIHRDVKPGNLLRSNDDVVKLADFGIAKAAAETSQITQVGSVLGTAAYLAPEQARGEPAGPAADLYALGVVTYQLLSGRLPYVANGLAELAIKQQTEPPPRLDLIDGEIPGPLADAVFRALALDPAARFESAEAMEEALRDGARGIGATAATTVLADPTTATRLLAPTQATEATRVLPRSAPPRPQPVPYDDEPAYEPAEPVAYAAPQRPRQRGPLQRALLRTLIFAALVAAAVGAVLVATQASDQPKVRSAIRQTTRDSVREIQRVINENTR